MGRDDALLLLDELGAGEVEHLGGSLLAHLEGTEGILRRWQVDEPVALAGLCHAAYGTDGFPQPLLGLDERDRLAAAVGDAAEAIVYRYAACDRSVTYPQLANGVGVAFADRFTGASEPVDGAALRQFALVTVANELELARRDLFGDAVLRDIAGLFDSLAAHVAEADDAAAEVRAKLSPSRR